MIMCQAISYVCVFNFTIGEQGELSVVPTSALNLKGSNNSSFRSSGRKLPIFETMKLVFLLYLHFEGVNDTLS